MMEAIDPKSLTYINIPSNVKTVGENSWWEKKPSFSGQMKG